MERKIYDFERDWLAKYPYRLSRKFADDLPEFKSHDEAYCYFKSIYADDFMLDSIEIIEKEKIYFYNLIVHRKNYEKFMKNLVCSDNTAAMDGMLSYHPVEIKENGNVHIIY